MDSTKHHSARLLFKATVSARIPRFWARSLPLARQCQTRGASSLSPLIVVAAAQGRLQYLRMFGTRDAEALSPARAAGGMCPSTQSCSRLLVQRIGHAVLLLCKVRREIPLVTKGAMAVRGSKMGVCRVPQGSGEIQFATGDVAPIYIRTT